MGHRAGHASARHQLAPQARQRLPPRSVSDASATGVNGQANPAGTNANPFLVDPHPKIAERPTTVNNFMTEQSTSLNGWIAGAIVSGTAALPCLRRLSARL